ncbi:MAG TPA: YbhB/YbcL family Raf kinase inhibitor-like protein [Vicinamibacterales bacterium]|nr:YbhB/YbcL family Raf kinase inhibitor-like protein [Vicinamibacterales bacterium]
MTSLVILALGLATAVAVQTPPARQGGAPPAATPAPGGQRQGGGGGRGGLTAMTLSTPAWIDGALMPVKYTQAGAEVSPPLEWTSPPETAKSLVLVVHDIDATNADGTTDTLHWLVWNLPATLRKLPEHVPQGPELPDGSRQISVTGPYYRGPAAPWTGSIHHYVFEIYALDAMVDVKPVGQTVAQTRAAVAAAMAGHVRGKGALVGRFKYAIPPNIKVNDKKEIATPIRSSLPAGHRLDSAVEGAR